MNAGDGLLLAVVLVVVEPREPVMVVPASALELEPEEPASTPVAPDGVATGETLAVEEMTRIRLEGVLMRDALLGLDPGETPAFEVESEPKPVDTSP